jgi:hypothetical protein
MPSENVSVTRPSKHRFCHDAPEVRGRGTTGSALLAVLALARRLRLLRHDRLRGGLVAEVAAPVCSGSAVLGVLHASTTP